MLPKDPSFKCDPPSLPRRAKVAAEWQAWAMAAQQDRWRLVAICPGNVYGPLLANSPTCGARSPDLRTCPAARRSCQQRQRQRLRPVGARLSEPRS